MQLSIVCLRRGQPLLSAHREPLRSRSENACSVFSWFVSSVIFCTWTSNHRFMFVNDAGGSSLGGERFRTFVAQLCRPIERQNGCFHSRFYMIPCWSGPTQAFTSSLVEPVLVHVFLLFISDYFDRLEKRGASCPTLAVREHSSKRRQARVRTRFRRTGMQVDVCDDLASTCRHDAKRNKMTDENPIGLFF